MSIYTESGYKTSRAENGDLVVHDVEIFCETERGGKVFDVVWIRQAFEYAMQQQRDRYLPPLHVKHHKTGNEVTAAGKFEIKAVKQIPYKGQNVAALIADFHVNDKSTEEALMMGKFPYRSVEIEDVNIPKIDGLALLDHDAPYLELPMLMIGSPGVRPVGSFEKEWRTSSVLHADTVACFSKKAGSSAAFVLFDFEHDRGAEFAIGDLHPIDAAAREMGVDRSEMKGFLMDTLTDTLKVGAGIANRMLEFGDLTEDAIDNILEAGDGGLGDQASIDAATAWVGRHNMETGEALHSGTDPEEDGGAADKALKEKSGEKLNDARQEKATGENVTSIMEDVPESHEPGLSWVPVSDWAGMEGVNGVEIAGSVALDTERGASMIIHQMEDGTFEVMEAEADGGDVDFVGDYESQDEAVKSANGHFEEIRTEAVDEAGEAYFEGDTESAVFILERAGYTDKEIGEIQDSFDEALEEAGEEPRNERGLERRSSAIDLDDTSDLDEIASDDDDKDSGSADKDGPGIRHGEDGRFQPGNMEKGISMKPERKAAIVAAITKWKAKKAQFEKDMEDEKSETFEEEGAPPAEGSSEEPAIEDVSEEDDNSASAASQTIADIENGTISIDDFDMIEAAMAARRTATTPGAEQQVVDPLAVAASPGEVLMEKKTKKGGTGVQMSAREAQLQGRVEALEADNAAQREAQSVRDDVSAAFERLKDRPLGADLKERLMSFRKEHGGKAFGAYTDSLAQTTGVLPDGDAAAEHFQAQGAQVDEVAMAYHEKGAAEVERAQSFCKQHEELAAGGNTTLSRERYVELNMARNA